MECKDTKVKMVSAKELNGLALTQMDRIIKDINGLLAKTSLNGHTACSIYLDIYKPDEIAFLISDEFRNKFKDTGITVTHDKNEVKHWEISATAAASQYTTISYILKFTW